MALTNAEKQRRHRDKLKACNVEQYKRNTRMAMIKSRCKKKELESLLPESTRKQHQRLVREKCKERVKKWRKQKKDQAAARAAASPFASAKAYAKATARARRALDAALPLTPKRRLAIRRKLSLELGHPHPSTSTVCVSGHLKTNRLALSNETVKLVQSFFQRDDVSRQAPGRKDVKTIRQDDGTKTTMQIRHLTSSIKETYALFCKEYPMIEVGRSKFAEKRPQHVLLSNKLPHNVCMCKYHENFKFAMDALHNYSHKETFLCNNAQRRCWQNECELCKDGKKFRSLYTFEESYEASWFIWKNDDEGRLTKSIEDGSSDELVEYVCSLIPQFVEHCFVKRKQATAFNTEREASVSKQYDPKHALIQIDFSENYTCVSQDEIQSAHWHQKQVSLFTIALWYDGCIHSKVIASNNITHSKDTIVAYIDKLPSDIPDTLESVSIWSDGPSSQFKNRFIAAVLPVLEKNHALKIQWNFFATSHGKGAVDGIGGAAKRHVWAKVSRRKMVVYDAQGFVSAASDMQNVDVIEMKSSEIDDRNKNLDVQALFNNAVVIRMIARMHHMKVVNGKVITSIITAEEDTEGGVNCSTDTATQCVAVSSPMVDVSVINVGDCYVVNYDGVKYPGKVTAIGEEDDFQKKPEAANKRGHYKFK